MENNQETVTGNTLEDRSWADSSAGGYYVDTRARVAQDGLVTRWQVFAKNNREIELVVYRGEPGNLTTVGRSGPVTPELGTNEFALAEPISVLAGDMIGWYTPDTGPIAYELIDGPWNTGDLSSRVLLSWAGPTEFSGSSNRVYSIAAVSAPRQADVSSAVKRVFDELIPKLLTNYPELATQVNEIFGFNITGEGGGWWTVDLVSQPPTCLKGDTGEASFFVQIEVADFQALLANPMLGAQLYSEDRLLIIGCGALPAYPSLHPMLLGKLQGLFMMANR